MGKKQRRKIKAERVNCKNYMPMIYVKGSCFETPLYGHVLGNKRMVIRTNYEKGEELKGGEGEIQGVKG